MSLGLITLTTITWLSNAGLKYHQLDRSSDTSASRPLTSRRVSIFASAAYCLLTIATSGGQVTAFVAFRAEVLQQWYELCRCVSSAPRGQGLTSGITANSNVVVNETNGDGEKLSRRDEAKCEDEAIQLRHDA